MLIYDVKMGKLNEIPLSGLCVKLEYYKLHNDKTLLGNGKSSWYMATRPTMFSAFGDAH